MEVCIYECAVVLDTGCMTQLAPSTRQLDNGEDRLEGKQDNWLGNGQGKLELSGWHDLVQESCLEENGGNGLEGKWYEISCAAGSRVGLRIVENIWFVYCIIS